MNLTNATALVTGGSSGIGLAIAKALVDAGSRVAITGRDEGRLKDAAKIRVRPSRSGPTSAAKTTSSGPIASSSTNSVTSTFSSTAPALACGGQLVDMDLAKFEAIIRTNVTGTMLMSREAAKHFIERKSGNIVNLASTAAVRGAANGTAYYGSKFAVRGMTECWRAELRQHNVRVFLINPSEVLTNFATNAGFSQDDDNPTKLQAEDIAHTVKAALEMNDRGFTTELTVFATNPKD